MKRYRDYKILCSNGIERKAILSEIFELSKSFDCYDTDGKPNRMMATCTFFYVISKVPKMRQGTICLSESDSSISIVNIVPPQGEDDISMDDYNAILSNFVEIVVNPALSKFPDVEVFTNKDSYSVEEIIPNSYPSLQYLVSGKYRYADTMLHPLDEKKYFTFLKTQILNDEHISVEDLDKYLEECGWEYEDRNKMTIRYSNDWSLIEYMEYAR